MFTSQTAINLQADFNSVEDLLPREKNILSDIKKKTGFEVQKILWKSDYYGSGKIGAINYQGIYQGKNAVLKIQGAQPQISEIEMIEAFGAQNKSQVIRPPIIYWSQFWDKNKNYEAFIMEEATGKKIIAEGTLPTEAQIERFFDLYHEYKNNCLQKPWLPKPEKTTLVVPEIEKIWEMSKKIKPKSSFRLDSDLELARQAASVFEKLTSGVDLQFQHGHLSVNDLITEGDSVIIFSNLFWKWRNPFFDVVFAYHWFIYSLAKINDISSTEIESQRKIWQKNIFSLAKNKIDTTLIRAALLERAIAGLLLDSFAYIDEASPLSEYLVESTRDQVKKLALL